MNSALQRLPRLRASSCSVYADFESDFPCWDLQHSREVEVQHWLHCPRSWQLMKPDYPNVRHVLEQNLRRDAYRRRLVPDWSCYTEFSFQEKEAARLPRVALVSSSVRTPRRLAKMAACWVGDWSSTNEATDAPRSTITASPFLLPNASRTHQIVTTLNDVSGFFRINKDKSFIPQDEMKDG